MEKAILLSADNRREIAEQEPNGDTTLRPDRGHPQQGRHVKPGGVVRDDR